MPCCYDNAWIRQAVGAIEADYQRSADTHLIRLDLPALPQQTLYLKDESTHPTGSLKHRLARSLFLYGLCNGWIGPKTPIIEASSGNTAISEAYFARLLGLPFIAVVPQGTTQGKIDQIAFYGGQCHQVEPSAIYSEAQQLAERLEGHYLDQFTFAERATDWRGNNNIAESMFRQLRHEPQPQPAWVVMSAGTGGTSATIGRYIHYRGLETCLCVADAENSVFFPNWRDGCVTKPPPPSNIEGIGRPRLEPSFLPSVVHRMMRVPDAAALAAMHCLSGLLNRRVGASTGTNAYAAFCLLSEMAQAQQAGSVVTLICDSGDRYEETYYNLDWCQARGFDLSLYSQRLKHFVQGGELPLLADDVAAAQARWAKATANHPST